MTRFLFYTHSLVSDWNHGNAHFQRGVMSALNELGHETRALEPLNGWSRSQLEQERPDAAGRFARDFPGLDAATYEEDFDHEAAVADADVVVVHEWTDPALVAKLGRLRRDGGRFRLLFHDTHHRAISADEEIAALRLKDYDLILAFGETLRRRYLAAGWGDQVVTWHEAADTTRFFPMPEIEKRHDLIWIGNWGDGERSEELDRFLIEPVRTLGLNAHIHGVRYPDEALARLVAAGISYGGWIANAEVPRAFAESRATVHVPRRPYVEALPGIPTIRVFEALACGIPLVSAPWRDEEGLFRAGRDFLYAEDGDTMRRQLRAVLADEGFARELARSGRETILTKHTCRHRAYELLAFLGLEEQADAQPIEMREAAE